MARPKLEWMYRNSSEDVDNEEYLLGRPIDKAFEGSTNKNEIEKDCLPSSLFANTSSRTQVDVVRKLKEDPLEVIKQKEIERRKQLLKNPVKLKKLQNMLRDKQHSSDEKNDKKKSKPKSNSQDLQDIDDQIASKCLSLMKKHGIKSLSDFTDVRVNKIKIGKQKTPKSKEDDSSSESEAFEDKHRKRKKKRDSSSESSASEKYYKKKSKHNLKYDGDNKKFQKRTDRSRSSSPRRKHSNYRSDKSSPQRNRNVDSKDYKEYSRHSSNMKQKSQFSYKNKRSNGLSEEEKQKRLQEMMENVQWRDKVRVENVARYKKEEAAENSHNSKEYNGEFLRKQMSIATSSGTVESRIKSNINSIQRSKFSMNENFARR